MPLYFWISKTSSYGWLFDLGKVGARSIFAIESNSQLQKSAMTLQNDVAYETDAFTPPARFGPFRSKRLPIVLLLLVLALFPGTVGHLTRTLMIDAYVQVSAFVAATLFMFYRAERLFKFGIGVALKTSLFAQVPISALLAATPGCGGTVIVVGAYSSGNVGFGAVVATLTAIKGDAAFLLIATRPDVAIVVLAMSFAAGIITGYLVDIFMKADYRGVANAACDLAPLIGRTRLKDIAYLAFGIPGLAIGVSQLMQVDLVATWGIFMPIVGLGGAAVGLLIWSTSTVQAMTHANDGPITRMAEETSFISVWVIAVYLGYDYIVTLAGFDLETAISTVGLLLPLIAICIGFIPVCGPQVFVTTLYINRLVPFSALLGNAISNDGDALFPAIALNPKAAVAAAIVSSVPAFILPYSFYFFAPNFF
ncbi:MAG: hypothetical protein ACI861_001121 [Paracoccaceae bacterium]